MQSNNYIDVKVEVWQRLHYHDNADMKKIVRKLKETGNANDVCGDEWGYDQCEYMYETESQIEVSEDKPDQTIEVYEGDKVIWQNNE